MRKTAIGIGLFGLAAFVAAPALATVLLSETFTYADGNLATVSGGNWSIHSGSTDIQVVSGTATGNAGNSADDNRTFAARGPSDKTYACFMAKIPTPATTPMTGVTYFAHFKDTGTTNFNARVYAMPSGSTFTFAISVSSANSTTFVIPWTSDLAFDTFYKLSIAYDAAAGTADLWVDPVNESSAKVTSSTSSSTILPTSVSAFALRQGTVTGLPSPVNWSWVVDDLGVGTTFDDACTAGTIAVQPSTWSNVKSIYRD